MQKPLTKHSIQFKRHVIHADWT